MPPDMDDVGTPGDWMRFAEADLALARVPLPPGGLYEQLCFHAQQAAEKSLKAVLVYLGIDFPPTHNLQMLLGLLPASAIGNVELITATRLTAYAVASRYPGVSEPVSEEEYRSAIRAAEAVVAWATNQLRRADSLEQ